MAATRGPEGECCGGDKCRACCFGEGMGEKIVKCDELAKKIKEVMESEELRKSAARSHQSMG